MGDNQAKTPGPDVYNPHKLMTEARKSSQERNAPRATIGRAQSTERIQSPTPGPNDYNNSKAVIGDGVRVPFTTAPRPISAQPGRI